MTTYKCIGAMSGSSLDGMDIVYVEVKRSNDGYQIKKICDVFQPFDQNVQEMARSIGSENLLLEGTLFGNRLSNLTAKGIDKLIKKCSVKMSDVDVIGIHGQTVLHRPDQIVFLGDKLTCTVQLCNISYLAEKTGITTVGNFRQRDMFVGGQGAPLMPYMHKLLYGSAFRNLAVHNLGGISNTTVMCNKTIELAFDTGPANIWIDTVVRWHSGGKHNLDKNGNLARKGIPDLKLMNELLSHPYLGKKPPKSTGWEEFGPEALAKYKRPLMKLSLENAVATVTHATIQSIVNSYQKHVIPKYKPQAIIFTGGGAKNSFMLEQIQGHLPILKVQTSETYGISVNQTEALGFALLGLENLLGRTANVPEATGAKRHVLCGEMAIGHNKTHIDRIRKFFQIEAK
ncbi:MAG: anhydro-N-acetylmuramic acid kinase [Bdellovibrionota bacterium]